MVVMELERELEADERGDEVLYLEKLDSLKELKYEWTLDVMHTINLSILAYNFDRTYLPINE